MEIEFKLAINENTKLEDISADPRLESLSSSNEEKRVHHSVYFDTADGYLNRCGISLRMRSMKCGDRGEVVFCMKRKPENLSENYKIREEYEYTVSEDEADESLLKESPSEHTDWLKKAGVPEETITHITGLRLVPTSEVTYTRMVRNLRISAETICELAIDEGIFPSGDRFKELELELLRGKVEELEDLVAYLKRKYKMKTQALSKRARGKL